MDESALSRIEDALDVIAQSAGAVVDKHQLPAGNWVVELRQVDGDWSVVAEGTSEAQALSNLIANAKAEGRAAP